MPNHQRPKGLAPGVASRLVDLLASDDGFRAKFQDDPHTALADLGHASVAGEPSGVECICLKPGQALASKEAFARDRERLQTALQLPMTFSDSTALSE
jgi:putative modified peptide